MERETGKAHYALVDLAVPHAEPVPQNFTRCTKGRQQPDKIVNLHGTIGTSHCMMPCEVPTADIMARSTKSPTRTATAACRKRDMPCNGCSRRTSCISAKF